MKNEKLKQELLEYCRTDRTAKIRAQNALYEIIGDEDYYDENYSALVPNWLEKIFEEVIDFWLHRGEFWDDGENTLSHFKIWLEEMGK